MAAREPVIMLELDRVSLSFQTGRKNFDHGQHHVLDDVSLQVFEGETLGIIGRNGVGKTTMLRLMAGILAPSTGQVRLREGKKAALLTLGLGFNNELTGRDNAMLAAMLQGASRKQARDFLEEIKDFSELGDSFEEPVKSYSAGMRARLSFTTALLTHVDVLLIDEVLSVGDAHFRGKAQAAMKERVTSDQTVVFVSHIADSVKALCDRVIWLEFGSIYDEGDPAQVMEAYQKEVQSARKEGLDQQTMLIKQKRRAAYEASFKKKLLEKYDQKYLDEVKKTKEQEKQRLDQES
ncbi:MAG: ABC transporter ATP-binding protein [Pseudomonadota bacterium]